VRWAARWRADAGSRPGEGAVGTLIGWANPYFGEMSKMFRWFQSGEYVADVGRQREVFGPPPAPEEAIAGFLKELGHTVNVPSTRQIGVLRPRFPTVRRSKPLESLANSLRARWPRRHLDPVSSRCRQRKAGSGRLRKAATAAVPVVGSARRRPAGHGK
jgi:hypothetical protein